MPNVLYHDEEQEERQREQEVEQGQEQQAQGAVSASETVTALALVATRCGMLCLAVFSAAFGEMSAGLLCFAPG